MIFTIIIFLSVETSFDKKKIEITHTSNHLTNQQTIIQNYQQNFRFLDLLHSQHDRKILVSFRFVNFNNLFASMTLSEFVTTTSESVSMKFLVSRLKRSQNACVRFFTSSQSTSMRDEFFTYSDTKANDMTKRTENIESIDLLFSQISSLFSQSSVRRRQ